MRRFHPLITGTLLLTAVGFFCRILGFFYRIFLSRTIGAEGLGLYQMIFPIHGIAFALCAGPDFALPPDRRLPGKGTRLFAGQPRTLTIDRPAADLFDLHLRRFSRRARPSCARMCAASARTRPLDPLLRDPCLLLRVLLRAQKNGSPGVFTGGRAVHPHFLRPADRPCLPHEQDSDHGAAGCLGAVDRGSGIGGVLSAGLWMLEACCHTAKYRHAYFQLFSSNTKKYHPFSILIPFYAPLYP